jgi:hypothetical protein
MEIERIRNRRWHCVSNHLRSLLPESRYSADACRKRYVGLINGEASIPIEVDDNPEERERERLARVELSIANRQAAEEAERKAREEEAVSLHLAKLERNKKKQEVEDKKTEKLRQQALVAEHRAAEKLAQLHASRKRSAKDQVDTTKRQKKGDSAPVAVQTKASEVEDPRSRLTMDQLLKLSKKRAIRIKGASKNQLVERLRNYDAKFSNRELQARLRALKRPINGVKDVLLYRLADIDYRYYNDHHGEFAHESDEERDDQDESELARVNEVFNTRDA